MPRSYLTNAVDVALTADVSASDTTIEIDDATRLPTVPFYLVIDPLTDTAREYCRCTNVSGTTLTVERDLDFTESSEHDAGDIVRISYVAQVLDDLWDHIEGILEVPAGGAQGDSLRKASATDGDGVWRDNVFITTTEPAQPIKGDLWTNPDDETADQYLPLGGGTMLGPLILDADPTDDLGAVTKQYVDNSDSGFDGSHGALTGVTADQHHTRYTDGEAQAAVDGLYLPLSGGAVSGTQALASKLVRNITASATEPGSPATGDIWLDIS